jgi:beta-lactam-binding protein with PASTA domain
VLGFPPEYKGPENEGSMADREQIDLPRRRPLAGYALFALVFLALAIAIGAGVVYVTRDRPVTIPSLIGLDLDAAAAAADESGLGLVVEGGAAAPEAVVVTQAPAPGAETERGTVVSVSLAAPPRPTVVPDVVGKTREEAETVLRAAGLWVGALNQTSDGTYAPGSIARQNPPAGSDAMTGTTVDLWVAGLADTVTPDILGMTKDEAAAAIDAAGLRMRVLTEVTDEVLAGLVFEQTPPAGERVPQGSVVVAVVNSASDSVDGGGDGLDSEVPLLFRTLTDTYSIPVLYPTEVPDGLAVLVGEDNPGYRVGPRGTQGFEVTYTDPERPDITLWLYEGNWFDPGFDDSTTVDVRGYAAAMGASGPRTLIVWSEDGTMYGVASLGIDPADLLRIANGLSSAGPAAGGTGAPGATSTDATRQE